MNRIYSRTVLAAFVAAATSCLAAGDPWDAPFVIQAGAFRAEAATSVRLDADTVNFGRRGTSISFEGDLGVTDKKTLPALEFLWRLNPRHGIEASWVSLDRSGTRNLSGEINWGDVTFPVNAAVNSSFDSEVWRVAYRYSPIHQDGNEVSLLLGAHYTSLKTTISSANGSITDSASVDVPLPTIGLRAGMRFADHWRLTAFAQFLKLKIGDYDGELVNGSVGVEWAFFPSAYAGLGYNYYRYKLESEKNNARGRFDFRFDGPSLYVGWGF